MLPIAASLVYVRSGYRKKRMSEQADTHTSGSLGSVNGMHVAVESATMVGCAQVCNITYARIQGKNAMVAHFQNSSLLNEDKRCRPVLFHSDGALAGESEPFPVGPAMRYPPPNHC